MASSARVRTLPALGDPPPQKTWVRGERGRRLVGVRVRNARGLTAGLSLRNVRSFAARARARAVGRTSVTQPGQSQAPVQSRTVRAVAAVGQVMNSSASIFTKETVVDGKTTQVKCVDIGGQTFVLSRGLVTVARVEDDWYDDVADPHAVIAALKRSPARADIFTFWQRLPEAGPRCDLPTGWDSIAAMPVTTFDHWLNKQIKPTARNKVRKAWKNGVEVLEAQYDDDFVRGMTEIFNETPVRQGRRFWHYGKDFETV